MSKFTNEINMNPMIDEVESALKTQGISTENVGVYWLAYINEERISQYYLRTLDKHYNIIIVWKSMFKEVCKKVSLDHIHDFIRIRAATIPSYISINFSESASLYRDMYTPDSIIADHCQFEKLETENFYIYMVLI